MDVLAIIFDKVLNQQVFTKLNLKNIFTNKSLQICKYYWYQK